MKKTITIMYGWLFFLLLGLQTKAAETLYINEIMASNTTSITDGTGSHEDWFEIYNPNNYEINLANYYFSDDASLPNKFRISSGVDAPKIPANGFLILWASSHPERGSTHTSFGLSAGGEYLVISSPDLVFIDGVTFGPQTANVSFGRQQDGALSLVYFSTASPATSNANGVTLPKLAPPTFSHVAGFHASTFNLTIGHPESGVTIRYTLDGSEPVESNTVKTWQYKNSYNDTGGHPDAGGVGQNLLSDTYVSNLYINPIAITNRATAPNEVSMKTSSIAYAPDYLPASLIYKGTVLRVRVFKTGFTPSDIVTRTFFINPSGASKYTVPVISVVSSENSFFDYTSGLYTPGKVFDEYRASNASAADFCSIGNFTNSGDLWERPGSVEFFDNNIPVLNQNFNFRIHGGCSRSIPQKTLRLYSDTEFNFPVFPEKPSLFPKRLLLRNSGNDYNSALIRDYYFQQLVKNLSFDTQLSRPAILFINSEYWGIQNITERYDKYYLEKKYNVNRNNVDLIDVEIPEADEGDLTTYNQLMDFVNTNSLANPAHYNTLKTMIDIDNFTDYQIVEIFSGNIDWPHKNTRLWRNRVLYDPNANVPYGHDGRWRWMLYDVDFGMGFFSNVQDNYFTGATTKGPPSAILRKLLENNEYKSYFINRLADLVNTTLLTSRALTLLSQTKALYTPLMQEHIDRWKTPASLTSWNQNVSNVENYITLRGGYFRNHVREFFNANLANTALTLNVNDMAQGYIKVNTIHILPTTDGIAASPYPWTGTYFQNNAITLTAIPKPGYHFVRWEKNTVNDSSNPELTLTITTATLNYKAVFAAGALPVVLKSFNAKKQENKVNLTWETTMEANHDHFVVERSSNAQNWSQLATVKGSGNTTTTLQQYHLIDEKPLPNINYYRLKQVDLDQTTTYSRIISVDMSLFTITNLWPNPVSDELNVTLDESFPQPAYEITDINGIIIRASQKMSAMRAVKIPVGNLAPGIYMLHIKNKDGARQSGKFVKQ